MATATPGARIRGEKTSFTFYCPEAENVECEIFDRFEADHGHRQAMQRDEDGYWHCTIHKNLTGKWYGYRVQHQEELDLKSPYNGQLFADPYSKLVTTHNTYRQPAKTYLFEDDFDWEGDTHRFPDDIRDLVIYETHLKDLIAHPTSGSTGKGCYQKFLDPDQRGGIPHLRSLGVNCVEFLPLQKFAPIEPPYGEETPEGFFNSWNPYSANYWGYMTSNFFCPETTFCSDFDGTKSGTTTAAVHEMKSVVKELHKNEMTVIMDVVYNHTSLFDVNPLTHLCPHTYLRTDEHGKLMNRSGTGNEFRSEHTAARQLILDSLRYWVEEYHVDGFRFDLAALLDADTWDAIKNDLERTHPGVVLIAEPWGGHYSPAAFSKHGWASWNDRIRNSIKGSDPNHDCGFIFSQWQHETGRQRLENVLIGTLEDQEGGLFQTSAHAVNYLESHDGYTLADFIRIALDPEKADQKVGLRTEHVQLSDEELYLARLAALTLFCSQGTVMIHAGQEFARSKIIVQTNADDPDVGKMDHNSYQKDNATNWLNFDDCVLNQPLLSYYRGLISVRRQSPALRKADPGSIRFDHFDNPLLLCFYISGDSAGDMYDYYVILNGNRSEECTVSLPGGQWEVLADGKIASSQAIDILSGDLSVPDSTGFLLRKFRH